MFSKPIKVVALALVSLGAACTSSEPVMTGLTNGSGAASAPAPAPFMPFVPTAPPPSSIVGPVTGAGGGPTSAPGTGGAAGAPSTACAGMLPPSVPPPPPGMPSPFPLDLSGAVTSQDHAPKPISGGTLLILRDGSAAVASDPDNDRLYVVDLTQRAVTATIQLSAGAEPGRLVEDGAGMVHVALRSAGAVATIDPKLGTLSTQVVQVCAAPRGLAYEAGRDLIHVACAEGRLVSLNAKDATVFRNVAIDRDARDVVALANGGLLVSTFRRADALALDADGKVTTRQRPPAFVRPPMPIPSPVSPAVAWRMVANADDTGAVMLHQRGVDAPISPTPGGYGGFGKGCGGIVETAVTVVSPGHDMAPSPAIQMSTLAVDVALSPGGSQIAVASAGNAHTPLPQIQITSLSSVTSGAGGGCIGAGPPPQGMPSGQVVAVAYSSDGTLFAQTREPAQLWSANGGTTVTLTNDTLPDTGHLIFHANSGSGIACASCHPEGGEDGRTWNFACLGARRTQSLRGRLSETAPFHWDGDMTTFPKLVDEVFVGRMAGPKTNDIQDAALLHWLDRVPELPVLNAADQPVLTAAAPASVDRGRLLFNGDAKCVACHVGTHLTNNTTVDVGTGLPLQVPSLLGVGWRAPFLHDGRAATLTDRFGTMGGGDKHGHTSQLSATDVADLVAYLESL